MDLRSVETSYCCSFFSYAPKNTGNRISEGLNFKTFSHIGKTFSSTEPSSAFGLRVVGGKMSDGGKLAAFVVDVVRGGPADMQAKLQKGNASF